MTAPAPRNHPAEEGRITVSVEVDSENLRHHAEQLADRGEHGAAHVLFTAAAHMEAGGEIPPWIGTVVDDDDDDEDRLTGPAVAPLLAHPAPTPAPVAVPEGDVLDPRVDDLTQILVDEWDRIDREPIPASAITTFGDLSRAVIAAGYRLVAEDDEDTVRELDSLREQLATMRELVDATRAPASDEEAVRVPLDGWRPGDWFCDERSNGIFYFGPEHGWRRAAGGAVPNEDIPYCLAEAVYVHAPREGGHR